MWLSFIAEAWTTMLRRIILVLMINVLNFLLWTTHKGSGSVCVMQWQQPLDVENIWWMMSTCWNVAKIKILAQRHINPFRNVLDEIYVLPTGNQAVRLYLWTHLIIKVNFQNSLGNRMCFYHPQFIFSPERVFLTSLQGFGYLFSEARADRAQLEPGLYHWRNV